MSEVRDSVLSREGTEGIGRSLARIAQVVSGQGDDALRDIILVREFAILFRRVMMAYGTKFATALAEDMAVLMRAERGLCVDCGNNPKNSNSSLCFMCIAQVDHSGEGGYNFAPGELEKMDAEFDELDRERDKIIEMWSKPEKDGDGQ